MTAVFRTLQDLTKNSSLVRLFASNSQNEMIFEVNKNLDRNLILSMLIISFLSLVQSLHCFPICRYVDTLSLNCL